MLVGLLFGINAANAAIPATFLEQSSSITGASDTLKISRLPVRPAIGPIKYYDVEFKLQVDATGAPVLAPLWPKIGLSPALLSAAFKAGNYKGSFGDKYLVTGPGATTAGRTNWSIVWTNPPTGKLYQATWTTGPVAGHPIQPTLNFQGITSNAFSWGLATHQGGGCPNLSQKNLVTGWVQIGNQLIGHEFCDDNNETSQFILSLCTAANPCP